MNYLNTHNLHGISTDKIIDNGICGKERPDRIFELIDKIIILECDEHQHKDRNANCEYTRMYNITQSFGGMPVYFIRWNPDDYETTNKIVTLQNRYKILKELLLNIINNNINLPNGLLNVIHLFFDNWKSINKQKWITLIEYNN